MIRWVSSFLCDGQKFILVEEKIGVQNRPVRYLPGGFFHEGILYI